MPAYCYSRIIPPSAKKETLAEVKCRLVRELAQRTATRVRYWMRREEWCLSKRGRVLIIGWEPIIVREIGAEEAAFAQENATVTSNRYVHHGQDYLPFNTLHQSHLITNLNSRNQSAQVRNPKPP